MATKKTEKVGFNIKKAGAGMSKKIAIVNYSEFFKEIKQRIRSAQYEALKTVNKELIQLYWDIGKKIVDSQEKHGWGKSIVESLAKDLQVEFPGIAGYSSDNLWRMRKFYLKLLNQTNFNQALPKKIKDQAKLAVKDEYTFDFLELGEEHSEKEMEHALVSKIKRFLSEMGTYFCYIGSQYRIEVDDEEYFIDLLLYHRKLRSLVAIELKIGKFRPEYAGKMQFYLSALDNCIKLGEENASIGIIICKEKKRTTVEYTLKETNRPMSVSTYKITSELPKQLSKYLPSKDEIAKRLEFLEK